MNALIIVDLQNDFLPGGALPVAEGDQVVPIVHALQPKFDVIVATQDWHPANHGSFAANHPGASPGDRIDLNGLTQILWPVHCVQNTTGAALVPGLNHNLLTEVFQKGTDAGIDSYSGFFDNGRRKATGLDEFLKGRRVAEVFIAGLATDYCVKFTALDAVELGLKTHVVADACRAVNLASDDGDRALDEMAKAAVVILQTSQIL
jgi:nicotinamidase/pyrazinamidase